MSTRSSTLTYNQDGQQIYNHYRHYDGYPDGHGKELAELLISIRHLKGDEQVHAYLDGMELLGCELENKSIVHGDIEYLYKTTLGSQIKMEIIEIDYDDAWLYILKKKPMFTGTPEDFLKSINVPIPKFTPKPTTQDTTLVLPRDFADRLATTSEINTTRFTDLIEFEDGHTIDIISHETLKKNPPFELILKDASENELANAFTDDPFAAHKMEDENGNKYQFKIFVDYKKNARIRTLTLT